MERGLLRKAIMLAQIVLSESARDLKIDGFWGPNTSQAFDSADYTTRLKAEFFVHCMTGQPLSSLRSASTDLIVEDLVVGTNKAFPWEEEVSKGNMNVAKVRDLIVELAKKEGVPVNTALKFFWIESQFNASAISRTGAKGVGQLTSIAVKDVFQQTGYRLKDPFDARDNITASLKYVKIVADRMDIGLDDPVALYMGYNIGPTAAGHVLNGNPQLASKQIRLQGFGSPAAYMANVEKRIASMDA